MITVIFLKFLHYLSLFLAGGLGVANAILFKNHQKAEMPLALPVQKTMRTLAGLGLVSIVLLWAVCTRKWKKLFMGTIDRRQKKRMLVIIIQTKKTQ